MRSVGCSCQNNILFVNSVPFSVKHFQSCETVVKKSSLVRVGLSKQLATWVFKGWIILEFKWMIFCSRLQVDNIITTISFIHFTKFGISNFFSVRKFLYFPEMRPIKTPCFLICYSERLDKNGKIDGKTLNGSQCKVLSVPFACVGSGDPVRVLRLYTMNTLDTLWSISCWGICTTCRYRFYSVILKPYALRLPTASVRKSVSD